jgi:hypothetical protein
VSTASCLLITRRAGVTLGMASAVENPVADDRAGSLLVNVWQASSSLPSRLALG